MLDYVIQIMQVSRQAQTKQHSIEQHTTCVCQLAPVGVLDIFRRQLRHGDSELSTGNTTNQLLPTLTACAHKLASIRASPLLVSVCTARSCLFSDIQLHCNLPLSAVDWLKHCTLSLKKGERALSLKPEKA